MVKNNLQIEKKDINIVENTYTVTIIWVQHSDIYTEIYHLIIL